MSQKASQKANRVQAYISDEMLTRLTQYAQDMSLSQSKAIESILEMALGADEVTNPVSLECQIEKAVERIMIERFQKLSSPLYSRMEALEHKYDVGITKRFETLESLLKEQLTLLCPSGIYYQDDNPSLEELERVSQQRNIYQAQYDKSSTFFSFSSSNESINDSINDSSNESINDSSNESINDSSNDPSNESINDSSNESYSFQVGDKIVYNGCRGEIIRLYKNKARIDYFNHKREFVKENVFLTELSLFVRQTNLIE